MDDNSSASGRYYVVTATVKAMVKDTSLELARHNIMRHLLLLPHHLEQHAGISGVTLDVSGEEATSEEAPSAPESAGEGEPEEEPPGTSDRMGVLGTGSTELAPGIGWLPANRPCLPRVQEEVQEG